MPGGGSTRGRIIFVVIGLVVLIILVAVIAGLLNSGKKSSVEQLRSIALQQAEISRVAGIGVMNARGSEARNLAITTQLSLQSDQTTTVALLADQKVKLGPKNFLAAKNPKTDSLLTDATERNQFDEVFVKELTSQLAVYQKDVKAVYETAKSDSTRQALATTFKNSQVLLSSSPPQTN